MRFFSRFCIESIEHRLTAIIRHTTSCDASARCGFSLAFILRIAASISVDGVAIFMALNISLILRLEDSNNIFCTALYLIYFFVRHT